MTTNLTSDLLTENPSLLTTPLRLPNGQRALVRLQRPTDAWLLTRYFTSLSAATRNCYGPHAFNYETACQLCATIDYHHTLRFIATTDADHSGQIIAYFILRLGVLENDRKRYAALGITLHDEEDTALAPSVADAYQSHGIGSLVMPHLLDAARRLGRQRIALWGGTQALNHRAIHFYEKFGFVKAGEFEITRKDGTVLNNYSMILTL
jgi:GNAT superfamily N-acetyltransferase